jgi:hypothetical protein
MPQPPTAGLSKATGGLRGCAHPRGELCTEEEHDPVDTIVHEIVLRTFSIQAAFGTMQHCVIAPSRSRLDERAMARALLTAPPARSGPYRGCRSTTLRGWPPIAAPRAPGFRTPEQLDQFDQFVSIAPPGRKLRKLPCFRCPGALAGPDPTFVSPTRKVLVSSSDV